MRPLGPAQKLSEPEEREQAFSHGENVLSCSNCQKIFPPCPAKQIAPNTTASFPSEARYERSEGRCPDSDAAVLI
jgi:hypothetical protein